MSRRKSPAGCGSATETVRSLKGQARFEYRWVATGFRCPTASGTTGSSTTGSSTTDGHHHVGERLAERELRRHRIVGHVEPDLFELADAQRLEDVVGVQVDAASRALHDGIDGHVGATASGALGGQSQRLL